MSIFYVNSTIEIEGKIRRLDGTLFNPIGVRVTVTTPAGVSTTYVWGVNSELQQAKDTNNDPITGVFILTYTPSQVGTYTYVFESYGDYSAKVKNIFQVEKA